MKTWKYADMFKLPASDNDCEILLKKKGKKTLRKWWEKIHDNWRHNTDMRDSNIDQRLLSPHDANASSSRIVTRKKIHNTDDIILMKHQDVKPKPLIQGDI